MNQFIDKLKNISAMLDSGKGLISEEKIVSFQTSTDSLESSIDSIMEEGRNLRLGIVGEVKAGKSSFLNALLFDGEDILPKAPTPMTAALTKIGYSETPSANIHFYSKTDWNTIVANCQSYQKSLNDMYEQYEADFDRLERERKSRSSNNTRGGVLYSNFAPNIPNYQPEIVQRKKSIEEFEQECMDRIPAEYRACKEVYDMTVNNLPDYENYLGKEEPITGDSHEMKSYLQKLNDYVGADGKFTSIVKYTEIKINNKMLDGVEIIDTPGLNDPITSRNRTTRKFLIECDAVFLMSYCGQFLGAEDMGFIVSSLPGEGIKKAVLIGSKFDSAILQYPGKASFKNAYLGTKTNCKKQASDNLNDCQITDSNYTLISQIKESLPPYCVSSLAYTAALQIKNSGTVTGEAEKWLVNNFKRRFSDFKESYDILLGLSSITDVRDKVFEETRKDKDRLIKERMESLYDSQRIKFAGLLEDIRIQAKTNQSDLQKYDKEELENRLRTSKENLDTVRVVVRNKFSKAAVDSKWKIKELTVMMNKELGHHGDIEVNHTTNTKHHSSTSGHLWWKHTDHWDEVIHTNTAEVRDVEKNIKEYRNRCLEIVYDNFKTMLKIDELKNEIKGVVMNAFNSADRNFDENVILDPLETSLSKISFPEVTLDLGRYNDMLDSMLGGIVSNGVVKNENIPMLKRTQDKILDEMSKDVIARIEDNGEKIYKLLEEQGSEFIDSIVSQLEGNMEKLRELIAKKEESLLQFESFINDVGEAKKSLRKVG